MGGNIPGGNFLGGDFPGGSLMGGNFPGGSLMGGNFPEGIFLEPKNPFTKCRVLKEFKRIIKFRNYLPSVNLSLRC